MYVDLECIKLTTSDNGHTSIATAFMGHTTERSFFWVGQSAAGVVGVARLFHASGGVVENKKMLEKSLKISLFSSVKIITVS